MLRNAIAHGGNSLPNLSFENYRILEEKILFVMNQHKSDIQEYCYNKFYKQANFLSMNQYISTQKTQINEFFFNIDKEENAAEFENENENVTPIQEVNLELITSM